MNLQLNYPIFTDLVMPKGRLPIDKAAHACFWYATLASKNLDMVGVGPESQTIIVDDGEQTPLWMKLNFDQIARSVALLYQLDSPEVFLAYSDVIIAQARDLGFELNPMIWKPFGVGVTRQ